MTKLLNRIFSINERKSSISRELLAGLITFVAMIYILPVNSGILGDMGMNASGVFFATAIVSGLISLFMGLYGNFPVVLSAGMGVNAYLAYTVYSAYGNWISALVVMLLAGIIFLIITLTPLREKIIVAIPNDIKFIISASLGGFIAFVGLKNAGIITNNSATFVSLGQLNNIAVILSLVGVLLVFVLMAVPNNKVNSLAIPISMGIMTIIGVVLYYSLRNVQGIDVSTLPHFDMNAKWGISGYNDVFFRIFTGDSALIWYDPATLGTEVPVVQQIGVSAREAWSTVISNPLSYGFIFSLILVNLFDTTATLMAVGRGAGLLNEQGNLKGGKQAILADAIGAAICAPLGTSTVTSFAESNVGVETGGKTGLMAVTSGLLFIAAGFLYPLFSVLNSPIITSLALVAVGALMFINNLKSIDWSNHIIGVTAFTTFLLVVLSYSLSDGIGFGLIVYILMMLVSKRHKEIKPMLYVTAVLFLAYYVVKAIIG